MQIERAAGGLVVRERAGVLQVLLIDDQYGKVSFPKGHVEPLETWEDAAIREVNEETGIECRIIASLGRVEYPISRNGTSIRKQVRLFLMSPIDDNDEPVTQLEELNAAYFLPWEEAVERLVSHGYENWNWVMDRASTEYEWHQQGWDARLRDLPIDTPFAQWLDTWTAFDPLFRRMLTGLHRELEVCVPEWQRGLPQAKEEPWPVTIADEQEALAGAIEHTLLRPEASALDIERLCGEAAAHQFRAVCVNPQHVGRAVERLTGSDTLVCTVVGFPLGATNTRALAAEVEAVVAAGATDVDMVIPIGSMKEDDVWTVYQHVAAVVREAKLTPNVNVKVILETHHLSYAQVLKATLVSVAAGADFVKTSTGFAGTGARLTDVASMVIASGSNAKVKAAGGIRNRVAALNCLRVGADRIGTSSSLGIMREV